MPKFSLSSQRKLATCNVKLQELINEVIKYLDISIISGHREEVEQNMLFENGYSKVKYPRSKHNSLPSKAVDIMYWNREAPNIRWENREQMIFVAGYIKAMADSMGIKIRLGADWNEDLLFKESFFDGGHVEIEE